MKKSILPHHLTLGNLFYFQMYLQSILSNTMSKFDKRENNNYMSKRMRKNIN